MVGFEGGAAEGGGEQQAGEHERGDRRWVVGGAWRAQAGRRGGAGAGARHAGGRGAGEQAAGDGFAGVLVARAAGRRAFAFAGSRLVRPPVFLVSLVCEAIGVTPEVAMPLDCAVPVAVRLAPLRRRVLVSVEDDEIWRTPPLALPVLSGCGRL